jgi:hypothetical protein
VLKISWRIESVSQLLASLFEEMSYGRARNRAT